MNAASTLFSVAAKSLDPWAARSSGLAYHSGDGWVITSALYSVETDEGYEGHEDEEGQKTCNQQSFDHKDPSGVLSIPIVHHLALLYPTAPTWTRLSETGLARRSLHEG